MQRIVFLNAHDLLTLVSQCPRWERVELYSDFVRGITDYDVVVAARPEEREAAELIAHLFCGATIEDPRTLQARGRINNASELALITRDPVVRLKLVVLRKIQEKPEGGRRR